MARPSEPLLAWLRKTLKAKGLNTANVADAAGVPRARIRKILAGTEDMTVDELMLLSDSLKLDPADLTGVTLDEAAADSDPVPPVIESAKAVELHEDLVVDAWGNQPEQLFRVAFELGCDFLFLAEVAQLDDSGVPNHVLEPYRGRELPIRLDAPYHRYNEPRYSEEGIQLTLSFDALYECTFKWTSIKQFVLFPLPPEPVVPEDDELDSEGPPAGVPHLRLVT